MDTAKAIGVIINNPEFSDVISLEGVVLLRNLPFLLLQFQLLLVQPQKLLSTTLSQIQARTVKWYALTHTISPVVAVVDPDMMSSMPKGAYSRNWYGCFNTRY